MSALPAGLGWTSRFVWVYQFVLGLVWADLIAGRQGYSTTQAFDRGPLRLRIGRSFYFLADGSSLGWLVAFVLLVGVQLVQFSVAAPQFPAIAILFEWPLSETARALLLSLVQYIVLIAFLEELWFRGLWFHVTGGRFFLAVVGGAMLFALYHAHLGPTKMLMTFGLGLAYGVARWAGASVLALTLVHGVMNWINSSLAPGIARIDLHAFPFATFAGFVTLAAILALMFGRFRRTDQSRA